MSKVSNCTQVRIEFLYKQNLHPAEIFKLLKGEGLLVSFVSETGIIKRLQLASSIENGFIYYCFNQGNRTVLFNYYEIIRAPNPLSPKPVHLDLLRFFCAFYLDTQKSPSSGLFDGQRTIVTHSTA